MLHEVLQQSAAKGLLAKKAGISYGLDTEAK